MKITTKTSARAGTVMARCCLGLGGLGIAAALLGAPVALADPVAPVDPVAPTAVPADGSMQMTAADPSAPPAAVPHLSSPENLPPGTTDTPPQGRLNYLRDLLHAIRTQDVSGSDALLLLAQRPLDTNVPPAGMPTGPTGPVGSSAPTALAPPVGDAAAIVAADPATS
ncbi:dopamine receptor D4 [Mycolicibacterium sp. CBM1]